MDGTQATGTTVIVYVGGPLDGYEKSLFETGAADGEYVVIPLRNNRYAWYKREGLRLVYRDTCTGDDIELVE